MKRGNYVDGYVLPVRKKDLHEYKKLAHLGGKIWKKHGALAYFECVGQDMHPNMGGMKLVQFPTLAKAKKNEMVIFSFIVFKSKAHRDHVNAQVMKDPAMKEPPSQMPFNLERMAYGGFHTMVKY